MKKIKAAIIGLGFGGNFVPIWRDHPNVESIGVFDTDTELMQKVAETYNIKRMYKSYDEILNDKDIDAVHLVSPIPCHAEQTIAALEAGKHCACTVPMATSIEDIKKIIETVRKTGKNYMAMETTLYTYHFQYVQEMISSGELGRIQFLRGSHYQDMEKWPSYWLGLPPMYYGTHAVSPMAALAGTRIETVVCRGSGTMREELIKQYNNPYPIECALFKFENGLAGEATRSLFETARMYQEGMFVYGSKKSFEWGFADNSNPYVETLGEYGEWRGTTVDMQQPELPNYYKKLPDEIQKYTVGGNFDPLNPQKSLEKGAGGGHHGSHPHLVHEFVSSILENRKPWIDENFAGNVMAALVCAHASAMQDGKEIKIPKF